MDTMVAPVVRLSIGIARLFQDVFVGERKWSRRMPGTPEYEAWEAKRAKYAAAIKSSGQRARVPFPQKKRPPRHRSTGAVKVGAGGLKTALTANNPRLPSFP
jgi:hypothetical protein